MSPVTIFVLVPMVFDPVPGCVEVGIAGCVEDVLVGWVDVGPADCVVDEVPDVLSSAPPRHSTVGWYFGSWPCLRHDENWKSA